VVFTISRPADSDQSAQWDNYWNNLSAANVKAVILPGHNPITGKFSGDGTNYYYTIPRPAYQMKVRLVVSGNVGKEMNITTSQDIKLLPTLPTNPYTLSGIKEFNVSDPGLDYYEYGYELVGIDPGTIEDVIWTYSGTSGIVRALSKASSKKAVLQFNALTGKVTITAQVIVKSTGDCPNTLYQTSIEVQFK
jgi:hypothetical protein